MLTHNDAKILDLLVKQNLLTATKVEEVKGKIIETKENLVKFLLKNKLVAEEKLTEIRAQVFDFLYQNLLDLEITEEALNFLPEKLAHTYRIICFAKEDEGIKIGMVEPNLKAIEAINFLANQEKIKVTYYLISESSWQKVFKGYQKIEQEISSALKIKEEEAGDELIEVEVGSGGLSADEINSAPVSRIVSVIIRHAVEARASDIHIEPYDDESRVRYRIDGILYTFLTLPKSIHKAVIARIKVLSKLKLDESRVPQDGRVRLIVNNREVDFRVSTLPLSNEEKVVMRILDTVQGVHTLEDLGFNQTSLERIRQGIKKTSGMVLVTGPTGSGKTTTLYAILNILNQEGVNISTLEDPIEYEIKGINQSQVRPRIGFSFATGLRSLLRQDPNIIMVGEIRDEETAELSIHASLTGHLVLSTLHTNDAIGAILRLIDMKVERFLLASTIKTVVAQRLARRLCDNCKEKTEFTTEIKEEIINELKILSSDILKKELSEFENLDNLFTKYTVYRAVGCKRCENTGYARRIAIAETLDINDELRNKINLGEGDIDLDLIRRFEEFITIKQDGIIKVLQGDTTIEEVLRVIES